MTNDPSHNSSTKYKVDTKRYAEEWNRIFGGQNLPDDERRGEKGDVGRDSGLVQST